MSTTKKRVGTVGSFLRDVLTLTKMQLKEKLNLTYLKSTRQTIFKIAWLVVEFAAITAICYLAFFFSKIYMIFALNGNIPDTVVHLVFVVMLALSVVFGTAGLVKSLYFSRDNMVLLTLPATSTAVFLSKLTVYYVYEFRKNFMFMFPFFIAYGIIRGYGAIYYPWLILMFLFISAVPVLVSALLSIPAMYVYQFVRKHKILQYTIYLLLSACAIALVLLLISLIPKDINLIATWGDTFYDIKDFLEGVAKALPFTYKWVQLVIGNSTMLTATVFTAATPKSLLILVGSTVVLFAACLFTARPLFYSMASKPFEYTKKANPRAKENRPIGGFMSAVVKELRIGLRSNALISRAVISLIVLPIGIELLNSLYSAMNTKLLGAQMTVSFNALIMLLILMSTNIDLASCYSRDGAASYLNKIQPTGYGGLIFSKILPNLVIGFFGTGLAVADYCRFLFDASNSSVRFMRPIDAAFFGITVFAFFASHAFWSAEMDIMNPQYSQYATFNDQANNPNENKSALLAFILSFAVFALSLLLGMDNPTGSWTKIVILSLVFLGIRIATFFLKVQAFYKEKV